MNEKTSTLPEGPELIDLAVRTALKAHAGQKRKGTEIPYSTHPLAVGFILAKAGCTDEVIAAGVLHDVVEDSPVTLEEIKEMFGNEVAIIVERVSEPDKSLPWGQRKLETIEYLKRAPLDIKFVALADKFHNISSMASDYAEVGEELWSRFNEGKPEQGWYFRGLAVVLQDDTAGETYRSLHKQFEKKVDEVFGKAEHPENPLLLPPSLRPKLKPDSSIDSAVSSTLKNMFNKPRGQKGSLPYWWKEAQRLRKKLGD